MPKKDTRVTIRLGSLYPLVKSEQGDGTISDVIVGILANHYGVDRETAPRGLAAVPEKRRAKVARKAQRASAEARRKKVEK